MSFLLAHYLWQGPMGWPRKLTLYKQAPECNPLGCPQTATLLQHWHFSSLGFSVGTGNLLADAGRTPKAPTSSQLLLTRSPSCQSFTVACLYFCQRWHEGPWEVALKELRFAARDQPPLAWCGFSLVFHSSWPLSHVALLLVHCRSPLASGELSLKLPAAGHVPSSPAEGAGGSDLACMSLHLCSCSAC